MPRVIIDSDDDDALSEVGGESAIANDDSTSSFMGQEREKEACADQHTLIHDASASRKNKKQDDRRAGERKGDERTQSTGSTGTI